MHRTGAGSPTAARQTRAEALREYVEDVDEKVIEKELQKVHDEELAAEQERADQEKAALAKETDDASKVRLDALEEELAALADDDVATLDGPGPLPQTYAEDAAYMLYTSGTTARPKGVLHAQRVVRAPPTALVSHEVRFEPVRWWTWWNARA